jgi:hypothetical protein
VLEDGAPVSGVALDLYKEVDPGNENLDNFYAQLGSQDTGTQVMFTDVFGYAGATPVTQVGQSFALWLHLRGSNARVGNRIVASWTSGPGPCPLHVASPPVLTVAPSQGGAQLEWSPTSYCDPHMHSLSYDVLRGTTPSPSTPIAIGLTTTSYLDTPLSAGTYWYRLVGRYKLPALQLAAANSNITPLASEIWGAVVELGV